MQPGLSELSMSTQAIDADIKVHLSFSSYSATVCVGLIVFKL